MGEEMAGRHAADNDATAGDRPPAGRAGPAEPRYAVRPVAWVESPLKHMAQAPNQGRQGAPPPAWLAVEPDLAEAIRDLRTGQQVLVLYLARPRPPRRTRLRPGR
jgi:tRNA (Thr-GGU) A37 N-methylase